MDERELVEALRWARLQEVRLEAAGPYTKQQMSIDPQVGVNRALLNAVRWFVEHEYNKGFWWCIECDVFAEEPHKDDCRVGQWVRAAREAGLG